MILLSIWLFLFHKYIKEKIIKKILNDRNSVGIHVNDTLKNEKKI